MLKRIGAASALTLACSFIFVITFSSHLSARENGTKNPGWRKFPVTGLNRYQA